MNISKKTIKILLMTTICLNLLSITSNASIQGKIKADNIRIRSEANTESKILGLISINEEVEVIEKEQEWYKIKYKQHTGYIKAEFINLQESKNEEEKNTGKTENVENAQQQEQETTNITENAELNVEDVEKKTVAVTEKIYILPLLNSKVIQTIQANVDIEVFQSVNGWTYIMTEQVAGWIRTDKIVKKEEKKEEVKEEQTQEKKDEEKQQKEEKTEKEINKIGYIKSASVNFRKGPSTSDEKLGSLTLNTEVKVLSEENGWYKILVNKQRGYVLKDLISFEKVEITSRNSDSQRQEVEQKPKEETVVSENKGSKELGQQIVDYAMSFVGYPYVYGGSTPSGFDCSGFTSYVYKHFGYSISRSSSAQASNGKQVAKSDLQLGDLVLFKGQNSSSIGHVGIYIGGNQFVHASTAKTGVKVSSLSAGNYIARYVTARRII